MSISSFNSNLGQDLDRSQRVRVITSLNPYMAQNMDAVNAMADLPISLSQLANDAVGTYGMMAGDSFRGQLELMSEGAQRSIWATLPKSQQMALAQLGYSTPETKGESWLGKAVGPLDEVVGGVMRAGTNALGAVGSPVLDKLNWVMDRPAHLYRTIRTMDERNQWQALGGAVIGGGIMIASRGRAGAGTLRTAGYIGLAGLAGASIAAGVTDPADFAAAFMASRDGEKTFKRSSRAQADELLGDPRVIALAEKVAEAEITVSQLAYEMAGMREGGENAQLRKMNEIVAQYATEGTPEFEDAFAMLYEATQDASFVKAVEILRNGKISPGRDVADMVFDPGEKGYSIVSGAVDAAWQIAVDPTLMLTDVVMLEKARRRGMQGVEGAEAATRFLQIQNRNTDVKYAHSLVARAIDLEDFETMRQIIPSWSSQYLHMVEYKRSVQALGGMQDGFTLAEFNNYLINVVHLKPLLQGVGTVKAADGVMIKGLGKQTQRWKELTVGLREFTDSLSDPRLERQLYDRAREMLKQNADLTDEAIKALGDDELLRAAFPASLYGDMSPVGELVMPWHPRVDSKPSQFGRFLGGTWLGGQTGEVLTAFTTMIPRGNTIALVDDASKGLAATDDIPKLIELSRYLGVPSYARTEWTRAILNARNPGDRMLLINSWLDNALTIAGAKGTRHGQEIVEKILQRNLQAYAAGGIDSLRGASTAVLPSHQALKVVMPDLHEMRKAARRGHMVDFLGLADLPFIETAVTKIWKPAVLLRIAFIPRAAGEEFLNFMVRGGMGALGQELGARSLGRRDVFLGAVDEARTMALTPLERELAAGGWVNELPAHLRPIGRNINRYRAWAAEVGPEDMAAARMMARYSFADPMETKMRQYATFLSENVLREGARPARALGARTTNRIEKMTKGLPHEVAVAGRRVKVRENVTANLTSAAFGNQYSWRRMLAGGVHSDLQSASRQYYALHARAIMGEVSAVNAGPVDFHGSSAQAVPQSVPTMQDGVMTAQEFLVVRGHFGRISKSDPRFLNAVHEQTAAVAQDPIIQRLIASHLVRVKGSTVKVSDDVMADLLGMYQRSIDSDPVFRILGPEFASGAPDADNLAVALQSLDELRPQPINGITLADALRAEIPNGRDATFEDLYPVLRQWGQQMSPAERADDFLDGLEQLRRVDYQMRNLPLADRRWAGPVLRSSETGHRIRPDQILGRTYTDVVPSDPLGVQLSGGDAVMARGATQVRGEATGAVEALPVAPMGVELQGRSPYLAKDQQKADVANKFIGEGSERSSTAGYAVSFGDAANTGQYLPGDVVMISAEGSRRGRVPPNFDEIDRAIQARATLITDDLANRSRSYNIGEREVAGHLEKRGYTEVSPGRWEPLADQPFEPTLFRGLSSLQRERLELREDGSLVFKPAHNYDGKTYGVSFTTRETVADDYATRLPGGPAALRQDTGVVVEIDAQRLSPETRERLSFQGDEDREFAVLDGDSVVLPPGSFRVRPSKVTAEWTANEPVENAVQGFTERMAEIRNTPTEELLDEAADFVMDANMAEWQGGSDVMSELDKLEQASYRQGLTGDTVGPIGEKLTGLGNPRQYSLTGSLTPNWEQDVLVELGRRMDDEQLAEAFSEWMATTRNQNAHQFFDPDDPESFVRAVRTAESYKTDTVSYRVNEWIEQRKALLGAGVQPEPVASAATGLAYESGVSFSSGVTYSSPVNYRTTTVRPPSPFYASFNDADAAMRDQLTALLLDANNQDQTMKSLRMQVLGRERGLEAGLVQLYVPAKPWNPDGSPVTYDQILMTATDRRLIEANRPLVEQVVEAGLNDYAHTRSIVVTDPALARELDMVAARLRGAEYDPDSMRVLDMDRGILDGRVHSVDEQSWARPLSKDPADRRIEVSGWDIDTAAINSRLRPPEQSLEAKAREWADVQVQLIRQRFTRGNVEELVGRRRALANGNDGAAVFVKSPDGTLIPTSPDEALPYGTYYDRHGKKLVHGDTAFFESRGIEYGAEGDMLHELNGPLFEQVFDELLTYPRMLPKGPSDARRVFRSKPEHVFDAGNAVPNYATAEMLAFKQQSWWDRVVEFGFDRVIGPSLDAIVRRPMAFHHFAQRHSATKSWVAGFADPGLHAALENVLDQYKALSPQVEAQVADVVRTIARTEGHTEAAQWSATETMAYARGLGREKFTAALQRAQKSSDPKVIEATKTMFELRPHVARSSMAGDATVDDMLARLYAAIPEEAMRSRATMQRYVRDLVSDPTLKLKGSHGLNEFQGGGRYVEVIKDEKVYTRDEMIREMNVQAAQPGTSLYDPTKALPAQRRHRFKYDQDQGGYIRRDRIADTGEIFDGETLRAMAKNGELGSKDEITGKWTNRSFRVLDPAEYENVDAAARLIDDTQTSFIMPTRTVNVPDIEDLAEANERWRELQKTRDGIDNLMLMVLDDDTADLILAYRKQQKWMEESAGEFAATAAIEDMIPFIDSHEFRTQFAEVGKGFLPFWYAEENFMKRWARTLQSQGPAAIAKVQLGYMGLKSAGVVRTDEQGVDWFVYPGSGLLAEAIAKIPGMPDTLPVSMMFQSRTDSMLPGMSGKLAAPSFTPTVSMPLSLLTAAFPELEPAKRQLLGDYGSGRNALEQFAPAWVINVYDAIRLNEGNTRFASAQLSAIAQLEANGNGLPDNASPGQQQEFLDRVRNHARVILFSQALLGFVTPGPAAQFYVDQETLWGGSPDEIGTRLSTEYQLLVQALGIEEGTLKWLESNPDGDITTALAGATNPNLNALSAYTIGKSESVSGAPLTPTEASLQFFDQHEEYFSEFPDASPWLLPQGTGDMRSAYAFDQQIRNDLRRRRSPAEFLDAVLFKEASGPYFEMKGEYLKQLDTFKANGNTEAARQLTDRFDSWAAGFKAAHPSFRDQLESSDGKTQRRKTLEQMRLVINDPGAPRASHFEPLQQLVTYWDRYEVRKVELGIDKTARGREKLERFKAGFETSMLGYVADNPSVRSFWMSVLRPEAGFD